MEIESCIEQAALTLCDQDKSWIIKRHLAIVKVIGIILIVISVCGIPPLVLIGTMCHRQTPRLDKGERLDTNRTSCVYVKQFVIGGNIRVTVCNSGSNFIVVDMRRFVNDTATIVGLWMDVQQWRRLKQITPYVDNAIRDARSYLDTI
jgi:hypothetical protein